MLLFSVNTNEMIIKMSSSKKINPDYPLYRVVFFGDRVGTDKLARRFSCATKIFPIRVEFIFEHDPLKALDKGVSKDPTVIFDKKLIIEGLIQAEEITKQVESYLCGLNGLSNNSSIK